MSIRPPGEPPGCRDSSSECHRTVVHKIWYFTEPASSFRRKKRPAVRIPLLCSGDESPLTAGSYISLIEHLTLGSERLLAVPPG